VLDPSQPGPALAPAVVIGIAAEPDRVAAAEAAADVRTRFRQAHPDRSAVTVLLTSDPHGGLRAGEPLPAGEPSGDPPIYFTGGHDGPDGTLPTLLDLAVSSGAPACALLEPMIRPPGAGWLTALLDPVLSGGFDLVAPAYARRRFEGVLVTGVVYPLTRALFGQRLRQPLGAEIVLSRRLAEHLLHDGTFAAGAGVGAELWVVTKAIARECKMAQVALGPRPAPAQPQPGDLSQTLARVLGPVFYKMELHAPRWQRVRGSAPVPVLGEAEQPPEDPGHVPAVGPLVSAFALGLQDLRPLWSIVLPPQSMLGLQRIPRDTPEAFRMPDALWARVIYDFAVGWRMKTMDREQLLRSLTPLYLGWVASWVNEVAHLGPAEADARVERLCAAFEAEKPYLISRWRWPDRFSP
jgi:hypothetical protein